MKKLLTVKNIIKLAAALFAFVSFFMMFASPLNWNLRLGETAMEFGSVYFPEHGNGAALPVIGFFLELVVCAAIACCIFVPALEKYSKFVVLGCAFVLIVCAVFFFCTKANFLGANNGSGSYAEGVYSLGAGPIVAAIFSILAACGLVVEEIVIK